jgi:diphosphomevalonate decarboxylase
LSQLLSSYLDLKPDSFESTWKSPSNIAFVKYWGKKGHQLPANPSLSMTLSECTTTTKTKFSPAERMSVSLKLEGIVEEKFATKIQNYLETLKPELPFLSHVSVEIETSNTFPHGTGIASSASGLSAFALTLTDYLKHLRPDEDPSVFFKRASFLARLASGSACRSVYGGFTCWGDSEMPETTDKYATELIVHPEMSHMHDSVLVIHGKEKNVSSTAGHGRMSDHFFAEARFKQAKHHFTRCVAALKAGDVEAVGEILEAEALSLHAMMLTSPQVYTLLKPNTIAAMEAIWAFRRETKLPLYFTLDAGPNLHLIYPDVFKNKISTFITHELKNLAEKVIDDKTGEGPQKC